MPWKHWKKIDLNTGAPQEPTSKQQPERRVGLLFTKELEKVTKRCKAQVAAIAQECRSGNLRFRDISFDLEHDRKFCLHGPDVDDENPTFTPAAVRRVGQIFSEPQFYIHGAGYGDVVQGKLGDCWFLSALAAVGTKEGLVEKLCVARDEEVGVYGFVFCRDGEWCDVIIDDQLFTKAPRWEALEATQQTLYHQDRDEYEGTGRKGGQTLYFARSDQENETWVPLLEKAYAKLHGDYESLAGGEANEGIEDLTGGISESIYLNDILNPNLFWEKDLMRANGDLLFSCAVMDPKGVAVYQDQIKGIVTGHAYAILKAVEFSGKKFLKIRNPWGRSEWSGRWSDGSKEWEGEWLEALKALDHRFGDDGEFIMEYSDFLTHFESVERTQLFDETWVHSSHWLNVRSRPPPGAWQFGDVSFTFNLPERTEAILVLSQSDTRFYSSISSSAEWSFDFKLFKSGSKKPIGSSSYSTGLTRSVVLRKDLPAGVYVVHVRLDREMTGKDITEKLKSWNNKKLANVLTQYAKSKSIATNFNAKRWQSHIPIPLGRLAGQDVLAVLAEHLQEGSEQRKLLKEKIAAARQASETEVEVDGGGEVTEEVVAEDEGENDEGEGEAEAAEEDGEDQNHEENEAESAEAVEEETPPLKAGPTHNGIWCDGCQDGEPIIGTRWKCMVCASYDLCDNCNTAGIHEDHQMLKIEHPADALNVESYLFEDDPNSLLLGFRVYSKNGAPVRISGQLANGQAIPWKKND